MNGWKRMPRTPENEQRFQRYLDTLGKVESEVKVKRLARYVVWRGTKPPPHDLSNQRSVYETLKKIGQQEYTNPVLRELGWWSG